MECSGLSGGSCWLQVLPVHIWLGEELRLREQAWLAQAPTAVGDGLGGHGHSCSIFHTKSAPGTFWNKLAVALSEASSPSFLF